MGHHFNAFVQRDGLVPPVRPWSIPVLQDPVEIMVNVFRWVQHFSVFVQLDSQAHYVKH